MAVIQVPQNVSSITVSGNVLVPASRLVTIASALDATTLVSPYSDPSLVKAALADGATDISIPTIVTSITINAVAYNGLTGTIAAVPAADATLFLQQGFILVTG